MTFQEHQRMGSVEIPNPLTLKEVDILGIILLQNDKHLFPENSHIRQLLSSEVSKRKIQFPPNPLDNDPMVAMMGSMMGQQLAPQLLKKALANFYISNFFESHSLNAFRQIIGQAPHNYGQTGFTRLQIACCDAFIKRGFTTPEIINQYYGWDNSTFNALFNYTRENPPQDEEFISKLQNLDIIGLILLAGEAICFPMEHRKLIKQEVNRRNIPLQLKTDEELEQWDRNHPMGPMPEEIRIQMEASLKRRAFDNDKSQDFFDMGALKVFRQLIGVPAMNIPADQIPFNNWQIESCKAFIKRAYNFEKIRDYFGWTNDATTALYNQSNPKPMPTETEDDEIPTKPWWKFW